jgi:hypothetical protein
MTHNIPSLRLRGVIEFVAHVGCIEPMQDGRVDGGSKLPQSSALPFVAG